MKLTGTVLVKIADWKNNQLIITPNPAVGSAKAKVNSRKAGKGTLSIFDAAGLLLSKQNITLQKGNNSIVINNITTLSQGYYTITLQVNNETISSKLLIWK
jgi:hypothetical protein